MSGDIRMGTRTQDSPFRETAWDHRLDQMLDDLKTTVNPDDARSYNNRNDSSLVSSYSRYQPSDKVDSRFVDIFRNTSRSDSHSSNRVEDGGLMKHHHKEYTSPDKGTKIVTDQYEYDSGDPKKKKVMKSTYSSYAVKGDLSNDLDALRHGPSQAVMDAARSTGTEYHQADTKGHEERKQAITIMPASASTTMESQNKSDSSTLTRLHKNINELDSMLQDIDREERREALSKTTVYSTEKKTTQNTVMKNAISGLEDRSERHICPKAAVSSKSFCVTSDAKSSSNKEKPFPLGIAVHESSSETDRKQTQDGYHSKHLYNGKSNNDDDEVEYINDSTGGEVRKIVWRNRFEKTYETQDSSAPSMTIEADARRHKHKEYMAKATDISRVNPPVPPRGPISPRTLQLQYAVYFPQGSPNISPGGQSWADPIPLPTPPQVSPRGEPGVAYVYTYGQSGGTPVQHLPPLNYVQVPTGEGSPNPNNSGNQPVIYHYSYHYTLQPGQKLPEGVTIDPSNSSPHLQPALQVVPPPRSMKPGETVINRGPVQTEFAYKSEQSKSSQVITNENDRTLSNILLHNHHHYPSNEPKPTFERPTSGTTPRCGSVPRSPDITRRNVNISINKTQTHHTTTHSTDRNEGPNGPSFTSTPFPNRDRSLSPERDTRYKEPYRRDPHLYYCKTAADSLERLRKPHTEPLPFPDTSPITSTTQTNIPRRIDDLMTSFSDSEDGLDRGNRGPRYRHNHQPTDKEPEIEPLIFNKNETSNINVNESKVEVFKKEDSKNLAGPPVYYPPGHHQLFDESMHTMTLKENKRRGMAKWRNEKASGYKESSSSSESKGGMAMVPVCLPLCCGAACTIM